MKIKGSWLLEHTTVIKGIYEPEGIKKIFNPKLNYDVGLTKTEFEYLNRDGGGFVFDAWVKHKEYGLIRIELISKM